MLASFLIGVVAGMRSMTPLALVAEAVRRGALPAGRDVARLADSRVSTGLAWLAAGELLGDKLPFAPDRIVAPGMAARVATGALAGAALASPGERPVAALFGAAGAVGAAYLTFDARVAAMRRHGQFRTGLVEDALALAVGLWAVGRASRDRTR